MIFGKQSQRNTQALGLDLGSRVVKAILMEQIGGRLDIQAAGSLVLPDGLVEGGVVLDPQALGRKLASQLRSWKVPVDCSVIVSIPSSLAVLRWVSLPLLEGDELRAAAKYKAKRHLPFSVDSAYVEATPVEATDGGHGTSLVIAVRREVVDSRAEALEYAGLAPMIAELEAQSILRVVERRLNEQSVLWRDASLTIIDIGAMNTHMYVVQNQRLQFIRGIRFGAGRFAEALADQLGIPFEDALGMMREPTTSVTPEGMLQLQANDLPIRVNVQAEFEKLTREFLRLLRYFRSLHPERSYAGILDHLILCGGFSGLEGLSQYLEEQLGLRVERAKPFAGMVGKFDEGSFESISNQQEAFIVSVGLALAGINKRPETVGDAIERSEFVWSRSA